MIIQTINLSKKFKDKLAVNNLNIHVNENEIYAFLGLNGAGKSTTIKMLTGLISSSNGTAIIDNYDLVRDISKIKQISSICPQETALSMKLTVYENIYFAIGVKVICLILGALGIANMWVAIFADVGVMVIAVLNAIRTLYVKNL